MIHTLSYVLSNGSKSLLIVEPPILRDNNEKNRKLKGKETFYDFTLFSF